MTMIRRHLARGVAALILTLVTSYPADAQQAIEYYHLDAVGSVRAVTDQAGALLERRDYLPFGEEIGAVPGQPRRFAGKEWDAETGYDYFGARYLSARTARFTSVDPWLDQDAAILNPQRWNRYAYALNNPLRNVDPDGRDTIDLAIGFGQGLWSTAKGIVTLPIALVKDPRAVGKAIADDARLIGYGFMHPGEVVDAYTTLATSSNDADQRALGAAFGQSTATVALAITGAKGMAVRRAPAQVQINRAAGNAFRDEIAAGLRNAGREVQTEVYKSTPFGRRYIDIGCGPSFEAMRPGCVTPPMIATGVSGSARCVTRSCAN